MQIQDIERILDEYVETYVPAMIRWKYPLTLVKGGPEYAHLPEQSHFAHIINGIFGLARLIKFLVAHKVKVQGLDEPTLRKAFAVFTIHEVHKDPDVDRLGTSEFSIPLEDIRAAYDRLDLSSFAELDEHLMRAGNVHKRSTKHGDLLLSDDPDALRIWLWVRIADTFASVKSPEEAVGSFRRYLMDLGPAFLPHHPPGEYQLYYHTLKDVRGVLTQTLHRSVSSVQADNYGLYPLLYFPTGTLYIGPAPLEGFDRQRVLEQTIDRTLGVFSDYSGDRALSIVLDEGTNRSRYDFYDFAYVLASAETLLKAARELALGRGNKGRYVEHDIENLLKKSDLPEGWSNLEDVEAKLQLDLDQPNAFMEHWDRARYYLLYADHIVSKLQGPGGFDWLLETYPMPEEAEEALRQVADSWGRGGFGKYVVPLAYHFLKGTTFEIRSAEARPPEEVLSMLHEHTVEAIQRLDTQAGRRAIATELGFRKDLTDYLNANLQLSQSPVVHAQDDAFSAYAQTKRKGHARDLCSICNRQSGYVRPLRTGVMENFGRVFSNRVLPAHKAPGDMRPWCPVCNLEFILRKLVGLGLPSGADYGSTHRIYLYVLPTFSFTPEHLKIYRSLLRPFSEVTNLSIRDYGQDAAGAPSLWLEHRTFDEFWIEELLDLLSRQSEWITEHGGHNYVGERIHTADPEAQPHYYLIVWEKATYGAGGSDTQIATRTEAWAKAAYAAAILSALTSCKVYVTERPYLPVSDPTELKSTITMDSPPPSLRGMIGARTDSVTLYGREKGELSGLETLLDLGSALWTITTKVGGQTKDKNIAARLGTVNASPLAGAIFYKEYGRANDWSSPPDVVRKACRALLEVQSTIAGGELMDLVEKLASQSLEIALPSSRKQRGKAHRFELVFREAISAMRKARRVIPEMRQAAVGGEVPSDQNVIELKRLTSGTLFKALERRSGGDPRLQAWGEDLAQKVGDFVDTLVDEVFLGRAKGSFARFLRLENTLADGIYYYTDVHLSEYWERYNRQKAENA